MRSRKALLSFVLNTIAQIINTIFAIIVRKLFFLRLGADLLGLNSLFSSVILYLSISELGIGQSVAMCLYRPLAEHRTDKVQSYMQFLKKMYYRIGMAILLVGGLIAPFIYRFTDVSYSKDYIAIAFAINVFSTAIMYFFSYKKILLSADQRNYVLSAIQIGYKLILNLSQIWILIYFSNYYFFLIVILLCNLGENIVSSLYFNKRYYFINKKNEQCITLDTEEKQDIFEKIKGLLLYKVSEYVIQGTDNIVISAILGSVYVAYYSNYSLIIMVLFSVFSHIGYSSMSGLGNILYSDKQNLTGSFSNLLFIQHLAFSITSCCFLCLSNTFIKIVYGAEYVIGLAPVILLTLVYDLRGYSFGLESLRNSAGLYKEDKYWNIFCAVINIILSVILAYKFGLSGIIIGTLFSYIIKELIILPRIVFEKILPKNKIYWYYSKFAIHFFITLLTGSLLFWIHSYLDYDSNIIIWGIDAIISVMFILLINIILFHKTREFKYFLDIVIRNFNIFNKIKAKMHE